MIWTQYLDHKPLVMKSRNLLRTPRPKSLVFGLGLLLGPDSDTATDKDNEGTERSAAQGWGRLLYFGDQVSFEE